MNGKTMKAWSSSNQVGVEAIELLEQARPRASAGKILVKVNCAALNFSDELMLDDKYQIKPPRPFIPGQEIAGTVVEVFEGSKWAVGTRITSKVEWGGFGEYALVPEAMPVAIPNTLEFSQAVALPVVYITAMVGLTECTEVSSGQTVVIHAAAGGIGLAAVQIAKALGALVIATSSKQNKLEVAKQHGADITINTQDEDWVEQVKLATEGKGADVILDPVGGDIGESSLHCIARDGVLLTVGFACGKIPKFAAHLLLLKRASVKGVYWSHQHDAELIDRTWRELFKMIANGSVNPLVDNTYRLDELPRAIDDLNSGHSVGKLVMQVE